MSSHPLPLESDPAGADWHEIEELLDQFAQASKSLLSASEFYRLLIDRLVPVLKVSGGAVWTTTEQQSLRLEYQVNLTPPRVPIDKVQLEPHRAAVEEVLRAGQPRILPPQPIEKSDEARAAVAGDWLILHPFHCGPGRRGAIELVSRGKLNPATGRELQRILTAFVELIDDFHRNLELLQLRKRAEAWQQLDQFTQRIHESLDADEAAFTIANESRRIIGCDRVSVLIASGKRCRVSATSGVDGLDRRSKVVRNLEALAARIMAGGDPLWYYDGAIDIPEQIERPLHAYLDESHARSVSIVPLREPGAADGEAKPIIGVLVAEQFQASGADAAMQQRVTAVAAHAAVALNNSLVHSRLPLSSLGRLLAKVRWLTQARQLPKTLLVLGAIGGAVASLALVPADFDIEARGELEPKIRRDVFASDDGVVSQLLVDDQARSVKANEPLIVLRKAELDLEFRRVAGEIQTADKKLASVRAERLENAPQTANTRRNVHQLAADEAELIEELKGLREQRAILEQQQNGLTLRSPLDGQALTWNLKQLLTARPVQRGQTLLTVADLSGPWVIELHLGDTRTGHVLAASEELKPDLDVSFTLASDPATVYEGRIAEVAPTTEVDDASEASVLVTVDFDKNQVATLRPGATVIAKIHCGRRAIGYVWLHDLYEYLQTLWW